MTLTLAEAALAYWDAGWTVFPLRPGAKTPHLRWSSFVAKRPTRQEVIDWWKAEPTANIALLTGVCDGVKKPLVGVDVDLKGGGDINDPRLTHHAGPVAVTQSGGRHYFFAHPGHRVSSVARPNPAAFPGVDIRGDGGYLVVWPSKGPKGDYSFERSLFFIELPAYDSVERQLAATTPAGGADEIASAAGATPATSPPADQPGWVSSALASTAIGGQRQAITRLAGYFAKKGIPVDIAIRIIWDSVRYWVQGERMWQSSEVAECVKSIYANERAQRGVEVITPASSDLKVAGFKAFLKEHHGRSHDWLVEGWLPDRCVGLVVAPPQTYKTFLLMDLALSVAMGQPFLGQFPVHRPGPVLFVQAEDPASLVAERLAGLAWSKARGDVPYRTDVDFDPDLLINQLDQEVPIHVSTGDGLSITPDGRAALRARVAQLLPVLVILDPLYAFAPMKDFGAEVPAYLTFLKRLRNEYGTTFLIAHHTKKVDRELGDAGREQTWGSTLMSAASEADWQLRRVSDGVITIQRHFKAAQGRSKITCQVDLDLDRVPALVVTELSDDEVVAAQGEAQVKKQERIVAGAAKGGAKAAISKRATSAAVLERVAAELRHYTEPVAGAALSRVLDMPPTTAARYLAELRTQGRAVSTKCGRDVLWSATVIDIREVS